MPLFERPPLETLASAKDRWTPLYLEHGRLEVDDSSVKWIGADGLLCRIPVATFAEGNATLRDQPLSFATPRDFSPHRVKRIEAGQPE